MKELIEKLESAKVGSLELDEAVAIATHVDPKGRKVVGVIEPRPYTTSIDAALTLVPEGCAWSVVSRITLDAEAVIFGHDLHKSADAATPALALCIAALKARAS